VPELAAADYLNSARVPSTLDTQHFGHWVIKRQPLPERYRADFPWTSFTILQHVVLPNMGNLHLCDDDHLPLDVVMEDSPRELRKHLPIWMNAKGRVFITGLGLGCVVRGLLASSAVTHVDVVEIDADILRIIDAEFVGNPRVALHRGDALTFRFPDEVRFDFAWHDLWMDEGDGDNQLQTSHAKLIANYADRIPRQGAWAFPRFAKKLAVNSGIDYLG
jgi:hypothetical protein